jgi:PDZ domain-containing secreted protein
VRRSLLRLLVAVALPAAAVGTWAIGAVPCPAVPVGPTCQLMVTGGPVLDTGALVRVDPGDPGDPGAAADPVRVRTPSGRLLVTTIEVGEPDGVRGWWDALLDPDVDLVRRDRLVPAGSELSDVAREGEAAMRAAQARAATLALALVGLAGGAADVTFVTDGVGGPSAGLMLALAVAARVASADPTAPGLVIAGTGALERDGRVVGVGGVDHKLRAAAIERPVAFLLPREDLPLARRTEVPVAVLLVPVDDLGSALDAVATLAAGRVPAGAIPLGARGR